MFNQETLNLSGNLQFLVDALKIDKDLVLEFVFYFSRFEYALKRERYLKNDNGAAEPDWDKFFRDNADLIDSLCSSLAEAKYIIEHPPKKQITTNGALGWVVREFSTERNYSRLCIGIRAARNNLFHGGKFPEGPIADVARNEKLIRAALNVLKELSSNIQEIKRHFDDHELST